MVVIVSVVLPDVLPAEIFVGFSAQVEPESPAATTQVKFTSAGKAAPAGAVARLSVTLAAVPAMICTVPGVARLTTKSMLVRENAAGVPTPMTVAVTL